MIKQKACPLCKMKFNQLHSHLRNKHRLSARERRPYMKITRCAVKHQDTVLNKTDIIVTEFEGKKSSFNNDFKDIEDLIDTSYLKTKSSLSTQVSGKQFTCSYSHSVDG